MTPAKPQPKSKPKPKPKPNPRNRGAAGVFLFIVLIAVAIILALVFMPGGTAEQAQQTQQSAQRLSIDIHTKSVADAVVAYRVANNNQLPESITDLPGPPSAYRDPWDTTFRMTIDDATSPPTLTLRSAGPDTNWETDDDLTATRALPF